MLLFRVVSEKSKDPLEKLMGDARQGRLQAGPYLAPFVNVIRGGYENPKLVSVSYTHLKLREIQIADGNGLSP